MSELHDLTALEQAAAVRSQEVSPVELVRHYLDRIGTHSNRLGAFVTVTDDRALEAAQRAEQAVRDADDPESLPPYAGVPTAIKDLAMTAGVRTTFGSAAMSTFVPTISAEVVHRIERAGLISLGKTNTPEFGTPCYTEPEVAPPARTPYDLSRSAGGSSGGAAAAVAGGLTPWAHGSDGGGSIRIPASVCGLVGFKPSRGRVSAAPLYGDPTGLATSGPIARTVRDAAALLDVLAGPAVGDPFWAQPLPAGESFLGWCDRDPRQRRVARFSAPALSHVSPAPECLEAYERATQVLVDLGHVVEDVPTPFPPEAAAVFEVLWQVLSASSPVPEGGEPLLRPLTRWHRDAGRRISGPEFAAAIAESRQLAAACISDLHEFDAVLTPTLARPPVPVGALRDDEDPARDFENQKDFSPYTSMWNVTGMPAVSLPLHQTREGLPVGVMLAGRPAEESLLLSLAAQVEEAAPWRERHPACW